MITARATGDDGTEVILLGVTHENLRRLMNGQPIRVSAETHPGFPPHLKILIIAGPNERALTKTLEPLISEATKVVTVPREKPPVQ
jgi:hypothetical protein